jgi:hypothetical protein
LITISTVAVVAAMSGPALAADRTGPAAGRLTGQLIGPAAVPADLSGTEDAPPAGANPNALFYDYYTFDECRGHDNGSLFVRGKNHFALCIVAHLTYVFRACDEDGVCVPVGAYEFRLTALGFGHRGSQTMDYQLELDQWNAVDEVDPTAPLTVDPSCQSLPSTSCAQGISGGRTAPISEWMADGAMSDTFDTTGAAGQDDGVHYLQDKVNYHTFDIFLVGQDPTATWTNDYDFRCDAAVYASGGGCIFHKVNAELHYSLSDPTVQQVAEHIKQAQDDPEHTYPGGIGITIPGKPGGTPLTRLYPGADAAARTYYNANNRIARATCRQYDPNWGTPGLQCDEYPFRSTWEGANYTLVQPGSAQKYSARMVNGAQNGIAGVRLGVWYLQDHILAKDAFWVSIDS